MKQSTGIAVLLLFLLPIFTSAVSAYELPTEQLSPSAEVLFLNHLDSAGSEARSRVLSEVIPRFSHFAEAREESPYHGHVLAIVLSDGSWGLLYDLTTMNEIQWEGGRTKHLSPASFRYDEKSGYVEEVWQGKAIGPDVNAQPRPSNCLEGRLEERIHIRLFTHTIRDWLSQNPNGGYETFEESTMIAETIGSFSGPLFFQDPNPFVHCSGCMEDVPSDSEVYTGNGTGAFLDWHQLVRPRNLERYGPPNPPSSLDPWTTGDIQISQSQHWSSGIGWCGQTPSTFSALASCYVTPSSSFTCYVWGDDGGGDGGGGGGAPGGGL